ncbi:restriction endonuclease subunit S [Campylobacter jejuni]|uniref:Restriction endonuclease subunit S n=3 Tax=Campylobacter jejuni TaxID=197 RepID=A0A6C7YLA7_CAMJU|nr:restriction endonuclease subunit S [Campylobacter jejuni]EAJ2046730.1 restriction endonuclease subunit S [Campylobacter coli]EAI7802840.1 restriction endonuclease subunit S [Campylobacter jejuni]EAJ2307121.1 restriction endonuclease subunit S [Campylobacter coli]EAJ4814731.1 restriction endonuclease subunit S [Campylobacter jejuni]
MKNFKDSGIEWLGEIPEHWKLIKCKNFFVLKSIPIGDLWNKTKLLSLTLNGVIERDINNPEGKFPSDFSTYQIVKEGDLIFCLFDVAETPRTIGLSKLNGMITSAYTIFEIKNQEKRFLEYFFIDLDNRKNLKFLYRGLRNTISKEDLLNLKIPLPPLKEQEQIANFLDEKCEQIKNFIEKKEKLITLLKEQKQAFINKATTKGLDKNVNFKDSGIEYLGEIPQHWRIVKLKYVAFTNIGLVYTPDDIIENPDEGYPVLRANNIQNGKIDYQDLIYIKSKQIGKKQIISSGDLLMCVRNGSENLLGKTAKIQDGYFSFGAFTAIIKSQFNDYFYWIFQTNMLRKSIASFSASNGIGQISQDDIKNFIISFPPLKEQEQIAQFLDSEISKIDKIIEKTKKQIKLIKEYKTTLINQAVCGRIDL